MCFSSEKHLRLYCLRSRYNWLVQSTALRCVLYVDQSSHSQRSLDTRYAHTNVYAISCLAFSHDILRPPAWCSSCHRRNQVCMIVYSWFLCISAPGFGSTTTSVLDLRQASSMTYCMSYMVQGSCENAKWNRRIERWESELWSTVYCMPMTSVIWEHAHPRSYFWWLFLAYSAFRNLFLAFYGHTKCPSVPPVGSDLE